MKIEIDTNRDSRESWQKAQKLIEFQYHISIYPLVAAPGGKEPGYTTSRWNIL